MSDLKLEIDDEEVRFLIVVCSEEIERCANEQAQVKFVEEWALSRKRLRTAQELLEKLLCVLEKIYEDDGLASRPDLN